MFVKLCLVYKKHQYFATIYHVLTIYAIVSLKAITLAPGWMCLLLIVTKLLRLSSIVFVKANRVDPDDMPYSVEYHLGFLVC